MTENQNCHRPKASLFQLIYIRIFVDPVAVMLVAVREGLSVGVSVREGFLVEGNVYVSIRMQVVAALFVLRRLSTTSMVQFSRSTGQAQISICGTALKSSYRTISGRSKIQYLPYTLGEAGKTNRSRRQRYVLAFVCQFERRNNSSASLDLQNFPPSSRGQDNHGLLHRRMLYAT